MCHKERGAALPGAGPGATGRWARSKKHVTISERIVVRSIKRVQVQKKWNDSTFWDCGMWICVDSVFQRLFLQWLIVEWGQVVNRFFLNCWFYW